MKGLDQPLPPELANLSSSDLTPHVLELVRRHFLGPWLQDRRHAHRPVDAVVSGMRCYRDYTPEEQNLAYTVLNHVEEHGVPRPMILKGDSPNLRHWLSLDKAGRRAALQRKQCFDLSVSIDDCSAAPRSSRVQGSASHGVMEAHPIQSQQLPEAMDIENTA